MYIGYISMYVRDDCLATVSNDRLKNRGQNQCGAN